MHQIIVKVIRAKKDDKIKKVFLYTGSFKESAIFQGIETRE